ncbi:cobalt-precorrin-5B C(1)-methyltransferase [Tepiditoga spiralis]|uniref:Cobalt-precorrin-5B C(1)-methyltransferase n=1 Tax=Tepiditoga spiralis TaxID=2108365 RepID=A0A7G1G5E3_9BACT|nr:cobalt-precorrin-5B (C(1))-methyltransferase CbiD [Tepiditoga spiralis]BBE31621.1 cobalt-precorrin-5B C(1)-methyltransferase [Tepiditoga spiralis]
MNWYINVNGKKLRRGFTTGTAATAALKASVLWQITGNIPKFVDLLLPNGFNIKIRIENGKIINNKYFCMVKKDSGDDIDITNNSIIFSASVFKKKGYKFFSAGGVGIITKDGLKIKKGEPAINPVPRKMMIDVLKSFNINGSDIYVGVENGKELAKQTFNKRLGIVNGISIIGTSGMIEPMSEEAWKNSLLPQMDVIRKEYEEIVFVLGGRGESNYKKNFGDKKNIVLCGNYFGFSIKEAKKRKFNKIHISGSFQKIIKLAAGNFNTDSRVSGSMNEILALYTIIYMKKYDENIISSILKLNPVSQIIDFYEKNKIDYNGIFKLIVNAIIKKLKEFQDAEYRVTLFYKTNVLQDGGYK